MSRAQKEIIDLEHFVQNTFRYPADKKCPSGVNLSEYFSTTAFLKSYPNTFSFTYSQTRNLNLPDMYDIFSNYVKTHPEAKELDQILFPFFCHIVMDLKESDDSLAVDEFRAKYLADLPSENYDDAKKFLEDDVYFKKMACCFAIHPHRIICKNPNSIEIFNSFITNPDNYPIRNYLVRKIILIPYQGGNFEPTLVNRITDLPRFSNVSILQAKIQNITAARFSPCEPELFAAVGGHSVYKINTNTNTSEKLYLHTSNVTTMSVSSKGTCLLTGDMTGAFHLWAKNSHIRRQIDIPSPIWCSDFASLGGAFALGFGNGFSRLISLDGLKEIRAFSFNSAPVTDLVIHPGCSMIACMSTRDPRVLLYDIRTAMPVRMFVSKSGGAVAPSFSSNGRELAFFDKDLGVYDIGSGDQIVRQPLQFHNVHSTKFSPDCSYVFVTSASGKIVAYEKGSTQTFPTEVCNMNESVVSVEMTQSNILRIVTDTSLSE